MTINGIKPELVTDNQNANRSHNGMPAQWVVGGEKKYIWRCNENVKQLEILPWISAPLYPFYTGWIYTGWICTYYTHAYSVYACSVMSDSATPWTVACQALLSIEFFKQEYWNGLPFPPPGDLSDPGIQLKSLASPVLAGYSLLLASPGKLHEYYMQFMNTTWLTPRCTAMVSKRHVSNCSHQHYLK